MVIPLTVSSPFSYTFATSGLYNVGIGIVDVDDTFSSSILSVSSANYQSESVPEPSIILGCIVVSGFGVKFKRKHHKSLNSIAKDTCC